MVGVRHHHGRDLRAVMVVAHKPSRSGPPDGPFDGPLLQVRPPGRRVGATQWACRHPGGGGFVGAFPAHGVGVRQSHPGVIALGFVRCAGTSTSRSSSAARRPFSALKTLDFTVPTGMPSRSAVS